MPRIDINKVETLFDMKQCDKEEQDAIQYRAPFVPDPLLLTPDQVHDILHSYYKEEE